MRSCALRLKSVICSYIHSLCILDYFRVIFSYALLLHYTFSFLLSILCLLHGCNYTTSRKNVLLYFGPELLRFLVDFYTSCTNGNRNEYSIEVQNSQIYPNCVVTLTDTRKSRYRYDDRAMRPICECPENCRPM